MKKKCKEVVGEGERKGLNKGKEKKGINVERRNKTNQKEGNMDWGPKTQKDRNRRKKREMGKKWKNERRVVRENGESKKTFKGRTLKEEAAMTSVYPVKLCIIYPHTVLSIH